jgi:hypothetical protein
MISGEARQAAADRLRAPAGAGRINAPNGVPTKWGSGAAKLDPAHRLRSAV